MTDTFTCDNCGDVFDKAWSDEEATAEAEELFPGIDVSDPAETGIVCDGCYEHIMARAQAEAPELIGPGWRGGEDISRCYQMASGAPVHVRPGCRCTKGGTSG